MIDYLIEDLIKHRRGMLLVDRLVSYDMSGVVVEVIIKEDTSFLNENYVPAWIGIEYTAQAVAVWAGLQAIQGGKKIKTGLLLSCRKYKSTRPRFMLGEVLNIHIREEFIGREMGTYDGRICDETGKEVVTVSLNTFMSEKVEEIKKMLV